MVGIDTRVVLFLLGITVLTAVVFGLAPAMHATAGNLSDALKEGGRGDSDGARRNRLRSFLVASEFALAFILLIGAGLMIRSFSALQSVDPGFNPHNVLSMVVSVDGTKEAEPNRRAVFYRELVQHVRNLPGVVSAWASIICRWGAICGTGRSQSRAARNRAPANRPMPFIAS